MQKDKTVIPISCPLTGIKIITCPVTTCSYNTNQPSQNCLSHRGWVDDLEFHAADIAAAKGVTVEQLRLQGQRAQKVIQRSLVLQDFLQWMQRKKCQEYPKVQGYHDEQLVSYVNENLVSLFPFSIEIFEWNMGKICGALNDKWWKEYSRAKDIDFVSASVSLGVPNRRIMEARDQFQRAYKRATKPERKNHG